MKIFVNKERQKARFQEQADKILAHAKEVGENGGNLISVELPFDLQRNHHDIVGLVVRQSDGVLTRLDENLPMGTIHFEIRY